jgi:hypothetical protein
MGYGKIRYEQLPIYKSTSVLFYEESIEKDQENYVLLAYHPELRTYSDFGGKHQNKRDRTFFDTAFRELLDELFGWKIIPYKFLDEVIYTLDKLMEIEQGINIQIHVKDRVHALIILNTEHLKRLLQICKNSGRTSLFYDDFPDNAYDLIHKRKYTNKQHVTDINFFAISSLSFESVDPRTHEDLSRLQKILERRYHHYNR